MDEEDGGELLKSTVESLPLMQTLRMLSASDAQLEQASEKVGSIVSNIDGLKTDSSELSNLIASLHTDRQSNSSSLVTSARELSALIKTDAEHKYNIWRDVAENVRSALDVNDLEVAHRNLQELKRLAMHKLLPQGSTLRGGDLPSDETSTNITPNFDAVFAEFSRRLREAIITVHWSRLAKLDLSQTLKHAMIMKSLGLDLHAELRLLFLNVPYIQKQYVRNDGEERQLRDENMGMIYRKLQSEFNKQKCFTDSGYPSGRKSLGGNVSNAGGVEGGVGAATCLLNTV